MTVGGLLNVVAGVWRPQNYLGWIDSLSEAHGFRLLIDGRNIEARIDPTTKTVYLHPIGERII